MAWELQVHEWYYTYCTCSGAMGMYTSCTCMGKQHWYMTFVDICTCTELLRNVALDLGTLQNGFQ